MVGQGISRKKLVASFFLVVLICAGVVVGLIVWGRLSVLWKQPSEQAVVLSRVCDEDVVATYNKIAQYKFSSSAGSYSFDEKGLAALAADIKTKTDYQSDPTCQTILLLAAIHNHDFKAALAAYSAVAELHSQHIYADSALSGGGSLSDYKAFIQELAPATNNGGNQSAQGGA